MPHNIRQVSDHESRFLVLTDEQELNATLDKVKGLISRHGKQLGSGSKLQILVRLWPFLTVNAAIRIIQNGAVFGLPARVLLH